MEIALLVLLGFMLLSWILRKAFPRRWEEAEARNLWNRFARHSLAHHQGQIQGKRVSIEYQGRFEGTRQAASVLKVGLEDLGAHIVGTGQEHDILIQIRRYSATEGLYTIFNHQGAEISGGVVRHDYLVAETVERIAECLKV
jgi:hypothetical protein